MRCCEATFMHRLQISQSVCPTTCGDRGSWVGRSADLQNMHSLGPQRSVLTNALPTPPSRELQSS